MPPQLVAADMAAQEAPEAPPATAAAVVSPPPSGPVVTAEIVFEPNSSYFPHGGEAELRRLVAAL